VITSFNVVAPVNLTVVVVYAVCFWTFVVGLVMSQTEHAHPFGAEIEPPIVTVTVHDDDPVTL
jgi:hypothetical protein